MVDDPSIELVVVCMSRDSGVNTTEGCRSPCEGGGRTSYIAIYMIWWG
jgi:hypothetical protein